MPLWVFYAIKKCLFAQKPFFFAHFYPTKTINIKTSIAINNNNEVLVFTGFSGGYTKLCAKACGHILPKTKVLYINTV